jgi:hypothetical protein
MERKKATDFPPGLLSVFDHYVHGEISRREFFDRAKICRRGRDGDGSLGKPPAKLRVRTASGEGRQPAQN